MSVASVADAASSTTLLVTNSSRNGASIFNNSTEILYVLQGGGTASTSNFSVKLDPGDYWESPHPNYVRGGLTGIWANNAAGAALVTDW